MICKGFQAFGKDLADRHPEPWGARGSRMICFVQDLWRIWSIWKGFAGSTIWASGIRGSQMLRFVGEMNMIRGSRDNQKPYFQPKSIKQDCLLSNAEMEKGHRGGNGLRRRCCRTVIRNRILMIKKVKLKQNQKKWDFNAVMHTILIKKSSALKWVRCVPLLWKNH